MLNNKIKKLTKLTKIIPVKKDSKIPNYLKGRCKYSPMWKISFAFSQKVQCFNQLAYIFTIFFLNYFLFGLHSTHGEELIGLTV